MGIIISPGGRDYFVGLGGQRIARMPRGPDLNGNGVWSLGFRGRCLLAGAGILASAFWILFSQLIGHLFTVSPQSQNQATERPAVSMGGGQSKTKPRAEQCY